MSAPNSSAQQCDCRWLEHASLDPAVPVKFDADLSEYYLVRAGGRMAIYHCPFCGGRAPRSRRESKFHQISGQERQRLLLMVGRLKSLDDVIAILGKPDADNSAGIAMTIPADDDHPELTEISRVLIYRGLSETAEIWVYTQSNGRVSINLQSKAIVTNAG
jgi:hypothetical protein